MPGRKKPLLAALAGLLPALLALYLALFLGGGGHGWTAPFFHSFLLFVTWPLMFAALALPARQRALAHLMLLAAVPADATLAVLTVGEWDWLRSLPGVAWGAVWGWLVLWCGWQVGAVGMIVVRRDAKKVDSGSSPE